MTETEDRVESTILINAPRSRVWQALSRAETFGKWFGANLAGQAFEPGRRVRGPMTIEGHTHVIFDVIVGQVEPERLLSWRWHPHAVEAGADYSNDEERTVVTYTLQDAPGGATRVTVVETGFDKVPPDRRMSAIRGVSKGWPWQMENLKKHAEAN